MRVKNVQTLRPDGWYGQARQTGTNQNAFLTRETNYVTDYLSHANNELMVCEKGLGTTRTVFGRGYERLGPSIVPEADAVADTTNARAVLAQTVTGTAYFQLDMLGSSLFAANEQGEVLRYAQRSVWGDMKLPVHGDLNAAGLEDNFRYTNYQYDPVIGKHFAQARFYDAASGRMLAKDPVKNGLNAYPYCGNDPVNHVDPTGEIPTILAGAGAGLIAGGIYGFGGSVISQLANGER